MYSDQILFWDTSSDATVSMSRSKKELKQKVISAHLTGGHVVIRPAELFEGEDFYFEDAVNKDGFLYNLMKLGYASLALDHHMDIEERAKWRFRDGTVFDRGQRYTNEKDIERIRKRTESRAEKIVSVGWSNCPIQRSREKGVFERDLNFKIRYLLSSVANEHIQGGLESEAAINYFIHGAIQVSSRSDLHDTVSEVWANDVPENNRKKFIEDCRGVLTFAAISNSAVNYGDRISELRGQNYNTLSYFSSAPKLRASRVESTILKSFMRVLNDKVETLESEKNLFSRSIFNSGAKELFENSTSLITPRDRQEIYDLLYGEFEYQSPVSLAQYVSENWSKLKSKDIDRLVSIRFDELEKSYSHDMGRSKTLLSMMWSCGIETVLLKVGAPFVPTLINALKDLKQNEKTIRPIFAGYRTEI